MVLGVTLGLVLQRSQPGHLLVQGIHETATVSVDGQVAGANTSLEPGTHTVTVEEPGRLPARYEVQVKPGESVSLPADAQPAGTVLLTTQPDYPLQLPTSGQGNVAAIVAGGTIKLVDLKPTEAPAPPLALPSLESIGQNEPPLDLGTPAPLPTDQPPPVADPVPASPDAASPEAKTDPLDDLSPYLPNPVVDEVVLEPELAQTDQPLPVEETVPEPEPLPVITETPTAALGENLVIEVVVAPSADRAVVTSFDESAVGQPVVSLLSAATQQLTTLPSVESAAWGNESQLFTFRRENEERLVLEERDAGGGNARSVGLEIDPSAAGLAANANGTVLAWYQRATQNDRYVVVLAWQDGGSWQTRTTDVPLLGNPRFLISPTGRAAAFTIIEDDTLELVILRPDGDLDRTGFAPLGDFWRWTDDGSGFWALERVADNPALASTNYAFIRLDEGRGETIFQFVEPWWWPIDGWTVNEAKAQLTLSVGPELQQLGWRTP